MSVIPPSSPPSVLEEDLTASEPEPSVRVATQPVIKPATRTYDPEQAREGTRGDLARGLLWLLSLTIGGMLVFVGLGRLDGVTLAQSVFPSLVTLAGTALGFYFGSASRDSSGTPPSAK
jgi:hypothetical protein